MKKHALILGSGKSGMAAARLLAENHYLVTITDDRWSAVEEIPQATLQDVHPQITPEPWTAWRKGIHDLVVISPGLDPRRPEIVAIKLSGTPVVSEFQLGAAALAGPVVAITGTNGKTTVTEMVTAILREGGWSAHSVGNIGEPVCEVARLRRRSDWWVCEVSSFQLEHCPAFRPRVAAVLNISDDHLDRYDSLRDYALTKWSIYKNHLPGDTLVIGSSLKNNCPFRDPVLVDEDPESIRRTNEKFSLTIGLLCGVPDSIAHRALKKFSESDHRREVFLEHNGVTYNNDSKSTNVHALEHALEEIKRPVILIAGGRDKAMDFARIGPLIHKKVKHLILIGEARQKLAEVWWHTPHTMADNISKAAELAVQQAERGDVVLLSPACASLDQFTVYKQRGNLFKEAICKKIKKTTN